tara:strand:+ start:274 stop:561 length:288 start_codon:yes stop_codon:yes gene_type:complete
MSNIKKNFFNPGSNKTIAKVDPKAKLPAPKKNTTFDPNYKSRFVSRMTHTLTKESKIPADGDKSNNYKKNGKPKKPNVGSMDRLLRLKASAFSAK